MDLLTELRKILGITPVNIGDLNRAATHERSKPSVVVVKPDPLDGIEITNEYEAVIKLLESNFPIVFVSGKAGTGKTTLIREQCQVLSY